jgi:2-polyprenyl-3-methyl-5-hydroxy-6-metoxy-1,4-benzoquinol methylase
MLTDMLRKQLHVLVYERCSFCNSLVATDERRDPQFLQSIYELLPASYWHHLNPQAGLNIAIEKQLGKRGLVRGDLWDVGCGNGNLLSTLGRQWRKRGIEPGRQAVAEARAQNLDVLLGTPASLQLREVADAVLLVDVVEHLPEPELELLAIKQMLRPGGALVVLTGRADARTARFAGPHWYYLHCIGHVTIFSASSFPLLLRKLGFTDVAVFRVEHPGSVGLRRWTQRIGGNLLRSAIGKDPAAMHYYRDHQLVLATKPLSSNP